MAALKGRFRMTELLERAFRTTEVLFVGNMASKCCDCEIMLFTDCIVITKSRRMKFHKLCKFQLVADNKHYLIAFKAEDITLASFKVTSSFMVGVRIKVFASESFVFKRNIENESTIELLP